MAEPFETLREVGVALTGFRDDVTGQFTTLKWIIGGVTAVGLGVAAMLFSKIDALEERAVRNTAILERIVEQLDQVTTDTGAIRENTQTASAGAPVAPDFGVFEGWIGASYTVEDIDSGGEFQELLRQFFDEPGLEIWVYKPE